MNQLDFPINEMMFITAQYKNIKKLPNEVDFSYVKLRFHAFVGKD